MLVTRAPKRLEVVGGWGDATVALPEGLWRDELTGGPCTAAPTTAAPTCSRDYPVALLRRVHRR